MVEKWSDEAGRAAYLAGLRAAQALIVERTDSIIKRHRGVQRVFGQMVRDEPNFDADLRGFLGRTYDTGEAEVPAGEAQRAIEAAKRFVEAVEQLLAHP